MQELRKAHAEWKKASHDHRNAARQRFIKALRVFNGLFLDKRSPKDSE